MLPSTSLYNTNFSVSVMALQLVIINLHQCEGKLWKQLKNKVVMRFLKLKFSYPSVSGLIYIHF